MSKLNCPNCGSPIDPELNKCPYCGTSYFDMSSLDFTNREPFYLKIKVDIGGRPAYITQKVVPELGGITINQKSSYVHDRYGQLNAVYPTEKEMAMDVSFRAVPDNNKTLMNIYIEE